MAGFRVVLPGNDVLEVPQAAEYVVSDDGALVLRTGAHELLRLPADGWLEVRALDVGPTPNVNRDLALAGISWEVRSWSQQDAPSCRTGKSVVDPPADRR